MLTVWVDAWSLQDVGAPFVVGDVVRWGLLPVEDDHLSRVVLGAAAGIAYRAERDLARPVDVRVLGAQVRRVRAVSCSYAREPAGLARVPLPGSGTLVEQRGARGSEPYGPAHLVGYVVELVPAPVPLGRTLARGLAVVVGAVVVGRLWLWSWETEDHRTRIALGAALLISPALEVAVWEVQSAAEPTLSQLLAATTYWVVVFLALTACVVTSLILLVAPVVGLALWLPAFACRVLSRTRPAAGALATSMLLLAEAAAVSHWPPWDAHQAGPWHLLSAVLAVDAVLIATCWRVRLPRSQPGKERRSGRPERS